MPHIHELIDYTVEVYIVHNNKVLLRLHDKYNLWLGVGGHVELDEEPTEAAIRESKEEVGLDVRLYDKHMTFHKEVEGFKELIPPLHMNIHPIGDSHKHICLIYYASSDAKDVIPENSTDKWLWLSKEEIIKKDDIKSDVKHYALSALDVYSSQ